MSHRNLIRWGELAAVLAGILRGIASFTPTAASVALQVFYFAIDVLLILGTICVYEFQKKETGRWGFFMKICKVQAITEKQKHEENICLKRPQRLLE